VEAFWRMSHTRAVPSSEHVTHLAIRWTDHTYRIERKEESKKKKERKSQKDGKIERIERKK
jgi:hypothetical protein